MAFFVCTIGLAAPISPEAHTLKMDDRSVVSFDEVVEDLRTVRLIFIGELHDNEAHHRAQLQIIEALRNAGVPVAVALEMFRSGSQPELDRWTEGEMSERDFLEVFNANWSMWPVYREIFLHARHHNIPMVGLNIPRSITQQVAEGGFASLPPEQAGSLLPVRCDVDEKYQDFIRLTLGGHGHNGANFYNFCEAQLLWDGVMAHTLLEYLKTHPGMTVVVLAGSGHSWKHGIPEQVRRQSDLDFRVLLPAVRGRIDPDMVGKEEADYLMLGLEEAPLH